MVDVGRLDVAEGKEVELDRVLLVADGDKVTVGKPTVEGTRVLATSRGDGREKKIIVFKFKAKARYRNKAGHRQYYTRLAINSIVTPDSEKAAPARRTRRSKNEVKEDGA